MRRPAFLTAQEKALAIEGEDADDDGRISAWESQVREGGARVTRRAFMRLEERLWSCRTKGATRRQRREVFGWANPFGASIGAESRLAAGAAELVAGVPIEI